MAFDYFHKLIAEGENPNGFIAITPNSNASDRGNGNNHDEASPNIFGSRWALPAANYPSGMGYPVPTRGKVGSGQTSNRNRSGE